MLPRGTRRRARGQVQSPLSVAGGGEGGYSPYSDTSAPQASAVLLAGGFCRGKGVGTFGSVGHPVSRVTPAHRLWALSEPLGGNGSNLKKGEPC